MPRTDAAAILEGLDPEQREVATSFGAPVVVIAGAGTGKTRAITHRIAYGAAIGAYHPAAVLAVTFTTRAAGELRARLGGLGAGRVQARTFHSAALRQARYFWPRAYGGDLPPVSDGRVSMVADAAHRLRLRPDQTQLRDLLTEVSWAKVSNLTPADYPAAAEAGGREVAGLDVTQVGRVLARYEQVKSERGVIDFDDILLCAAALLGDHDDIAAEVRRTYQHLVVDEYQDVNPMQQTLLDLWRGDRDDLCVVGDPAQTIHSFAGANPGYLTGFPARFPQARVIRLVRDYRSTPQVVRLANAVARRAALLGTVTLESQRPSGPEPRLAGYGSEGEEAAAVARWVREVQDAGVDLREIAVLYRVHAQSPLIEAALSRAGIPFLVSGGEGFYQRAEVTAALRLLDQAGRTSPAVPAAAAIREVLSRLGWTEEPPAGQGRVRERWESWSALIALADDLTQERPGLILADYQAELAARAEAEHVPAGDGVTLATLHAAKGLEWDAVALVGAQDGTLPLALADTPAEVAEEGRLCYVGVTRARSHLLITWARTRRGGGAARRPSRFLEGLVAASEPNVRTRRPANRRSALSETCRVCGGGLTNGAERKLRRHRGCTPDYDEATYTRLTEWRRQEAAARGQPAFCVFTDATLIAIAECRPADRTGLLAVPGVGKVKADQFGEAVLALLALGSDRPAVRDGASAGEAGQVAAEHLGEPAAHVELRQDRDAAHPDPVDQ